MNVLARLVCVLVGTGLGIWAGAYFATAAMPLVHNFFPTLTGQMDSIIIGIVTIAVGFAGSILGLWFGIVVGDEDQKEDRDE